MSTPGIPRVDSGEEMPRYMRFNLQNLGHMLP